MEQKIDVCGLEPPEPLERILDGLADLAPGDWLRVRHRRDPVPLYRMLRDMGYAWQTTRVAVEHFEIVIWPQDMPAPAGTDAAGGSSA
ncbi:MAG: DUF2249 domain-containing protein [Gammaproteobacteria bacterium]|nr:DUF2249 domain-containing protein [Gammaproteobacteria bacterium]